MFPLRTSIALSALVAALACAEPSPVVADGDGAEQDEARRAVEQGAVRPLAEILSRPEVLAMGDVVRVKLRHDHGRWVYDLRAVDREGRLHEVQVDAATGAVSSEEDD